MTTPARHDVRLDGTSIGTLVQRGDHARFVFHDDYWHDPDRHVLGLWFEDDRDRLVQSKLRLPAWFGNLLPEGRLREWIALEREVSPERELELLLQVGHDLPGAVTVHSGVARDAPHDVDEAAEYADDAAERPDPAWRFSLAGVGLKFSMVQRAERLTLPSSYEDGDWIVKLPDPHHAEVPRNEYAMMRLAAAVGIETPEARLVPRNLLEGVPAIVWPAGEDLAYAVRRFDRPAPGRRTHIEDFAQVRGFGSTQKYEGAFETVAALTYRGHATSDLQEFARRLAFNALIGNGDAHLKNWSLIYPDGRRPQLSPAYDLVSTGPYAPILDGEENLGLKFGGSRSFEGVTRRCFDELARRLDASHASLGDVVAETATAFESAWNPNAAEFEHIPHVAKWIDRRLSARLRALLG